MSFVFTQRKRHISSHVSDDYEDIDEAEDSRSAYAGNNNVALWSWCEVYCVVITSSCNAR